MALAEIARGWSSFVCPSRHHEGEYLQPVWLYLIYRYLFLFITLYIMMNFNEIFLSSINERFTKCNFFKIQFKSLHTSCIYIYSLLFNSLWQTLGLINSCLLPVSCKRACSSYFGMSNFRCIAD